MTWGGTVMVNQCLVVNIRFNQQSSHGRQIRHGVYQSCDEALILRVKSYWRYQHPGKASQAE